jgi:folate-dependent phosphoribosylglycinamide formyltransferase PurN
MKIAVFTSNQPRHIALIESLAGIADEVFAVQECTTVFPGQVDDFFRKSPVMQEYFSRVMVAEREVFGGARFVPRNVRTLSLKMRDLSSVPLLSLGEALGADVFVVFGASYIKGPLCEHLVSRGAMNIHMGVSPFYRGSSTNFWAMYDGRPELVGATIHLLSKGLDSGPILFHAFPPAEAVDPFVHGMRAVQAAHRGIVEWISSGRRDESEAIAQDRSLELRYTRNSDFTDVVAGEYLRSLPTPHELRELVSRRDSSRFVRPLVA